MNGNKILVDTNVFINLGTGNELIDQKLEGKIVLYTSITEIELLGYHNISQTDFNFFTEIPAECICLDLSFSIKVKAIELRKKYKLKTPDAIIAASALDLGIPILTGDTDFKKILPLNLILI